MIGAMPAVAVRHERRKNKGGVGGGAGGKGLILDLGSSSSPSAAAKDPRAHHQVPRLYDTPTKLQHIILSSKLV